MKAEIIRFCSAAVVALALVGAAFAKGEMPWGIARFSDADNKKLTSVNDAGEAVLTDADLADGTPVAIDFQGTEAIPVGGIVLSGKAITFSGAAPLQADGTNSAFRLTGGEWTFKGLTFRGAGETEKAVYDGGAIDCEGGKLTLEGCTFTNLVTRFTGGAVSARELTGDMLVTNCTFIGNKAHPINGYGGALYASATEGEEVRLDVVDCRFDENMAENGGAICTLVISSDDEEPVTLAIRDGVNGTSFETNRAVYEGGAVFAEGPVWIEGSNTLFRSNWAGFGGGAVCLTGIQNDFSPVTMTVTNGVVFADNETSTNVTWTAGGAIAVMPAGCRLEIYGSVFTNNLAKCSRDGQPALGGAIYTGVGVTNLFWKTAFVDNDANAGNKPGVWCYGGAISVAGGATTVDTCVFDYGSRENANCYGNAIDFNEAEAQLVNSTFRRSKVEAVSTYNGSLAVTNCVLVGNGSDAGSGVDAYLEGTTEFAIAYSAYGTIAKDPTATVVADDFNLTGRTTAIYAGDTLRLDGSGFNPVAGLGLKQDGVTDFADVGYGTLAFGSSMGAYETPTTNLVVMVDASKEYDGKVTTNDETEVNWSLVVSNTWESATWADLGSDDQLKHKFTIDAWTYGNSADNPGAAGYYDSTNAQPFKIVATITPVGATNAWLATLLSYRETGTIRAAKDVQSYLTPNDFAWNDGNPITPSNGFVRVDGSEVTFVVSNKVTNTVVDPDDYVIWWEKNSDPTAGTLADGAYLIVSNKTGNFAGTVLTNVFSITAYRTEYYTNPTDAALPGTVVTNGALIGSNAVAAISAPPGCCLDYQNSTTNATVYKFGDGGDGAPDVTTLKVVYETDVVGTDPANPNAGDGVPDKYQMKVLFATVNGYWNDRENGRDRYIWVTLTNETPSAKGKAGEGTWAVNGKCTLAYVPPVGEKPFERFQNEGVWNTDAGASPAGQVVTASSFPVFFYSPKSKAITPRDDDKPVFALLKAAVPQESSVDVNGLRNALAITGFAIGEAGEIAGLVEAQVVDSVTGQPLAAMELANARIEILGVENLGDDWQKVAEATTDADGAWSVERISTRRSGGPTATKDFRTAREGGAWEIGSATFNPKFFTVRLITAE